MHRLILSILMDRMDITDFMDRMTAMNHPVHLVHTVHEILFKQIMANHKGNGNYRCTIKKRWFIAD